MIDFFVPAKVPSAVPAAPLEAEPDVSGTSITTGRGRRFLGLRVGRGVTRIASSIVAGAGLPSTAPSERRRNAGVLGGTMPIFRASTATRWGSRNDSNCIFSDCSWAFSSATSFSMSVAVKDACCMDVLKNSSPATPPTSSSETRATNGTLAARRRDARGTTVSRARSTAASAIRGTRVRAWLNSVLIRGLLAHCWADYWDCWVCSCHCSLTDALDGTQAHRGGPGVRRYLRCRRLLRAPGHQAQRWLVTRGDEREVRRKIAPRGLREHLLGDPVLERVVGHHHNTPADADRLDRGWKGPSEHRQLVVDLDPEG